MSLYLRLAWRNLWRHRRRTLIIVAGIGMGLALMMAYDGFIAGFDQAIYGNAIKVLGGNIQIHTQGYQARADQTPLLPLTDDQAMVKAAKALPQVLAASRRINTGGLASNRKGAFSVAIAGIEPEQELPVNLVAQHVSAGRYLTAADQDQVYVGKGLADAMEVKVGDRITLAGRAAHSQLRSRTMTVVGIFDVGMPDIEKTTLYMSLAEAQNLYGLPGQSTEVALTLQKIGQEDAVMKALKPILGANEITSWQTNFPDLTQAIDGKNGVMTIFSIIILVIAGIGILNLLLMAIYERTREIGVLGAFGMRPSQISTLFLLEGGLMGVVGVVFGLAVGLLFNSILGRVGVDFSSYSTMTSYMALISGRIYSSLGIEKLPLRVTTVLIIAFLAAYYPAREASRREPAEALHYV